MIKVKITEYMGDYRFFCKKVKSTRFIRIFYPIFLIFWTLLILALLCSGSKLSDIRLLINLEILLIVYQIVIIIYLNYIMPKYNYNKCRNKYGDNPYIYEFKNDYFTCCNENGNTSENISMEYIKLYSVFEYKNYFILYESRNRGYIIRKSAIIEGSAEKLRTLFETNLGNKFVSKVNSGGKYV